MSPDEPLEYSYGQWGTVIFWLGLPAIVLVDLVSLAAAFYGITAAGRSVASWLQSLLVLGVGLYMAAAIWQWIRDRHAFWTRYQLSQTGIFVDVHNGVGTFVNWSDFDSAVDCRILRYIKLRSGRLEHPVVLLFGTPGKPSMPPLEKQRLARQLVQEKLGARFTRPVLERHLAPNNRWRGP